MDPGSSILQDLVHFRTYAKTKENGQRETRDETIARCIQMHQDKFPALAGDIDHAFQYVSKGLVAPSMRSLQFGGDPILRSNARIYNCGYTALTSFKDFADFFYLLMNGVGVGYSVQHQHVSKLPKITGKMGEVFQVPDTKEGWADSILRLLENPLVKFDFSLVRGKGVPISSGGVAAGPEVLEEALEKSRYILLHAIDRRLRPVEAFDICCHLAGAVVVSSVRRSATICGFDADDEEMLRAKSGSWWVENPQRARANVSAVVHRSDIQREEKIRAILHMTFLSGAGEPGIILTNDYDILFNPCAEIALRDGGLCNLTDVNIAAIKTRQEFLGATKAAAIIGTLQAAYTDFEYLAPKWRRNAEEEALLGCSMTGQAMNWDLLTAELLNEGAQLVLETNAMLAPIININPTARATTTKPSGTVSAWWGVTSGIHAAHAEYYLRRVRVDRKDELAHYLITKYGVADAEAGEFIEADWADPENIIVTLPVQAKDAIQRDQESALDLLKRAKHVYDNWVIPGHVRGPNTHNVSLTVSYHHQEEQDIMDWMVENHHSWSGISLLPYDGGTYRQTPYQEISQLDYQRWLHKVPADLNLTEVVYSGADNTQERMQQFACTSNSCEII